MEIQLWRQILCPYELAVRELTVKFNHMIKEHHEKDLYSPITQVFGRVKSVASILDKLQRKNIPLDRLEQEMDDIAGIRLICQFVEDIAKVEELIRARSDMEVVAVKDYLHNIKPSGYRSYHLIIAYTVETLDGPKKYPCRDPDPHDGNGFLVNDRAFPAVQIQGAYARTYPGTVKQCSRRHCGTGP